MKMFFYPHAYLRERQLDTIRRWNANEVVNPELAEIRTGAQVNATYANARKLGLSWKQKLPLVNVKLRPKAAPKDAVVYVWGGIIATGDFIVDLDNPWSLVGYNLRAMPIYRIILKRVLLSKRCREIRCMSEACRKSLRSLFGERVYQKSQVHYPCIPQVVQSVDRLSLEGCRFLFIGTQFDIKGGVALLKALQRVYEQAPDAKLDVVTHLPSQYEELASRCPGIRVHPARFSREQIHEQFMRKADVLVLPTYVESFGMVALEALAYGMAVIATDVYALNEMVENGRNGNLLEPPMSIWDDELPSRYYWDIENIKEHIARTDTSDFETSLAEAMLLFATDVDWRLSARRESVYLMKARFSC
jgi:glycosyltransferase involved in cell wall biosynthesis